MYFNVITSFFATQAVRQIFIRIDFALYPSKTYAIVCITSSNTI